MRRVRTTYTIKKAWTVVSSQTEQTVRVLPSHPLSSTHTPSFLNTEVTFHLSQSNLHHLRFLLYVTQKYCVQQRSCHPSLSPKLPPHSPKLTAALTNVLSTVFSPVIFIFPSTLNQMTASSFDTSILNRTSFHPPSSALRFFLRSRSP